MPVMKRYFGLNAIPLNADLGKLVLRLALPFVMLRYHGWGKVTGWANEAAGTPNLFGIQGIKNEFNTFPDYIGITSQLSYIIVAWSETIGCVLVALGLFMRLQSFVLFAVMMVAWIFHHHLGFRAPHGGETAFLFAMGFLALFLLGPGRYSLDRKYGIGRS